MSRYTCHECKSEHGTDNMVAYCAWCVGKIKQERHPDHSHCVTPCDSIRIQSENHSAYTLMKERAESAESALKDVKAELERERMRLAACGVAAMQDPNRWSGVHPDYESASLRDVMSLAQRSAAQAQELAKLRLAYRLADAEAEAAAPVVDEQEKRLIVIRAALIRLMSKVEILYGKEPFGEAWDFAVGILESETKTENKK